MWRSAWRMALTGLVGLCVGVMTLLATVLAFAFVTSRLANRGGSRPLTGLISLGAGVLLVVAATNAAYWAATLTLRRLGCQSFRIPGALGAVAGFALLVVAEQKLADLPLPEESLRIAGLTQDPDPSYDVMLVLDPSESGGRRLVRLARQAPRAFDPPPGSLGWNVAVGVTAVDGDGGSRTLLLPTRDRSALVRVLARLPAAGPLRRRSSYTGALLELANPRAAAWRPRSIRAVTIVRAALPEPTELGSQPPPTELERMLPDEFRRPPFGVSVFAALNPFSVLPRPGQAGLYVAIERESGRGAGSWPRWLASANGHIVAEARGQNAATAVEAALTGGSDPALDALALRFRPALLFDRSHREPYRPLDVDRFLGERTADGGPAHELCHGGWLGVSPACSAIDRSGLGGLGGFVRMAAAARLTPDGDAVPQRLYYHATQHGHHLYLDYWWFFRFNLSPYLSGANCAVGIGIADVSCFDHEGDWEGVTVALRDDAGKGWTPDWVTYAGHDWRYRFYWGDLRQAHRTRGGHTLVYVAFGSHAAYPRPCQPRAHIGLPTCHQPRSKLPDGSRDGGIEWIGNMADDGCAGGPCVVALPERYGSGALWNGFPGRWGRAYCVVATKICVRSAGPKSPYYQTRYGSPATGAVAGRPSELR